MLFLFVVVVVVVCVCVCVWADGGGGGVPTLVRPAPESNYLLHDFLLLEKELIAGSFRLAMLSAYNTSNLTCELNLNLTWTVRNSSPLVSFPIYIYINAIACKSAFSLSSAASKNEIAEPTLRYKRYRNPSPYFPDRRNRSPSSYTMYYYLIWVLISWKEGANNQLWQVSHECYLKVDWGTS